jgi:RNA polymerase sigma-70 factor (ECF subfamily)
LEETAFRSFYYRTVAALRSYLRMLARDCSLADDFLQESYLRFLKAGIANLNEFQMKSYLYKIAISVANDHWRSKKRDCRSHINCAGNEPSINPNTSHEIGELFDKLDLRQQSLLWLAHVEGFRHDEITKMLGLKKQSVRVLLFRARQELALLLKQEGLGPREQR